MKDKYDKIRKLVDTLNNCNYQYYANDNSLVSDAEFDALYDELVELETTTDIIQSNSPTQYVGSKLTEKSSPFQKVTHDYKLMSLNKTKDIQELIKWMGDNKVVITPKYDGLTVDNYYKDHKLSQSSTRGDGEVGEDISTNIKLCSNVRNSLTDICDGHIIGECLISYQDFKDVNETHNGEFKNPRNLASGSLRQLVPINIIDRKLTFIPFDIKIQDPKFTTFEETLTFLGTQYFADIQYMVCNKTNIEEAITSFINDSLSSFPFPIDGLVIRINDLAVGESMGVTNKFPNHSMAFKFQDAVQESVIRDIIWQVSRSGRINPVANFDEIEIDNTLVSNASIHNVSIMKSFKFGKGDKIEVYKANCIIPQIYKNLTHSDTFEIPNHCPSCNQPTIIEKDNDTEFLYCRNLDCPAQLISRLTHIVSKAALDIRSLSEQTLSTLIDSGIVNDIFDIFKLSDHEETIVNLERFAMKKYQNTINAIELCKTTTSLDKFIYALSIPTIGRTNSKEIVKYFNHDFEKFMNATLDELIQIKIIGPIKANNIHYYFKHNHEFVKKFYDLFTFVKPKTVETPQILESKTFCITGKLVNYTNRDELKSIIESYGGSVTGTVSKNTSYLINNDTKSASSKNKKAIELAIPILTEHDFESLLESLK